jgi:hypothetical protein
VRVLEDLAKGADHRRRAWATGVGAALPRLRRSAAGRALPCAGGPAKATRGCAGPQGGGRTRAAPRQLRRAGGAGGHVRRLLRALTGVTADLVVPRLHRRDRGAAARAPSLRRPRVEQHPALRRRRLDRRAQPDDGAALGAALLHAVRWAAAAGGQGPAHRPVHRRPAAQEAGPAHDLRRRALRTGGRPARRRDPRPHPRLRQPQDQRPLPRTGLHGSWLGPRWNEAIGVRRCDVNPLRQEITFGKVVVNQNGPQTYVERLSKTEDFPTIPVPQPVMDRLLELPRIALMRGARTSCSSPATGPTRCARDVLRAAVQRAGLQRHVTCLTAAAHRRVLDVRRWPEAVRSAAAPRAQEPDHDRGGVQAALRERIDEGRKRMEDYMLTKRHPGPPHTSDRLG